MIRTPSYQRKYYSLLEWDGIWRVEFGDYSLAVVQAELQEYKDKGVKARHLRIITTGTAQGAIDRAVANLNGCKDE